MLRVALAALVATAAAMPLVQRAECSDGQNRCDGKQFQGEWLLLVFGWWPLFSFLEVRRLVGWSADATHPT